MRRFFLLFNNLKENKMKKFSFLLVSLYLAYPCLSHAAFPTCEDARNYGRNTAVLFGGMVYNRLNCNVDLRSLYENALANMASTPLGTNDSDEQKVCYFEGYYSGLTERLPEEYKKCYFELEIPEFVCIPPETIAMYASNVFLGASNSLEKFEEAEVSKIFGTVPEYEICEEVVAGESCADTIKTVLKDDPFFSRENLVDVLIERVCPSSSGQDGEM